MPKILLVYNIFLRDVEFLLMSMHVYYVARQFLQSSKQYSKFPDLGLLVTIYDMTYNTHLNDILLK